MADHQQQAGAGAQAAGAAVNINLKCHVDVNLDRVSLVFSNNHQEVGRLSVPVCVLAVLVVSWYYWESDRNTALSIIASGLAVWLAMVLISW